MKIAPVMIDIETLGTEPGACILSIGACRFTPEEGVFDNTFYTEIDIQSCKNAGLTVDKETREWWEQQPADLRPFDGDTDLSVALAKLKAYTRDSGTYWAKSPTFDLRILDAAFAAVDITPPWEYYEERDVRTIYDVPGYEPLPHNGRQHNALDDAIHQAREVATTIDRLEEVVEA